MHQWDHLLLAISFPAYDNTPPGYFSLATVLWGRINDYLKHTNYSRSAEPLPNTPDAEWWAGFSEPTSLMQSTVSVRTMIPLVLVALTLTSLSCARPLSVLADSADQDSPIDPQIVKWLQSQDPSLASIINSNGNVNHGNIDHGNNSHSWKDLFKYMAQLNDYYVLFGRAR